MEFWAQRKPYKSGAILLLPADNISAERALKLSYDKLLRFEAVAPRNPQHHRLCFALFGILADAFDMQTDDIRDDLLKAIGHSYSVTFPNGETRTYAKSIAYAAMDDIAFRAMFEKLVKATYSLYGILPADIKREIDKLLAPDRKALPAAERKRK